jgi:hypothetical protein
MASVQGVDMERYGVEVRPALALDGEGAAYIAAYWMPDASAPLASIVLPREVVASTVLSTAGVTIELRIDGSLVAFAYSPSMQTLASVSLTELVTEALRPELVALEGTPSAPIKLEAELELALALVREFRAQRSID